MASALIFAAEQCVRKAGASDARAAGTFSSGSQVWPSKFPYFVHPRAEFDAALAIFFSAGGRFFLSGVSIFFSKKSRIFRSPAEDSAGHPRAGPNFPPAIFHKISIFSR